MSVVVVAAAHDEAAKAFANRHREKEVRVLTPTDLSRPGWHHCRDPMSQTAVVGGDRIEVRKLTGVVTRLAGIGVEDLPEIVESDREYVAAEMTAFLVWWLTSIAVPVLNRPMAPTTTSPSWSRAKWTAIANQLGIPATPFEAHVRFKARDEPISTVPPRKRRSVTIVGNRCFGDPDPSLRIAAKAISARASVDSLVVRFVDEGGRPLFLDAGPWIDLREPQVGDAVMHYFEASCP